MLQFRPMRPDEYPLLVARATETALAQLVERELPGASYEAVYGQLEGMYQRVLAMPGGAALVAELRQPAAPDAPAVGPVAHVLLMPQPNPFTGESELVVMDIYTHPLLRGRGVGRQLLRLSQAYGDAIGCRSLVAQVAFCNPASLALFQRAGFRPERTTLGLRW